MQENKIKNKTILITGGAGFIGSHLASELIGFDPKKIIILDNLIRGTKENMKKFMNNPLVEFVQGDIIDFDLTDRLIKESDYIFHLSALRINACTEDLTYSFNSMVKAIFELAESAVRNDVKKIIFSSSASVYGLAQNFPTPESDNPYNNTTFYGAAKLWGEQILRSYKNLFGLDYTALRYFNVYGPGMDATGKYTEVMIRWLDSIRNNTNPVIHGDGSTTMDFVYISDVVKANIAALNYDVSDMIFNIGSGKETSLKELLNLMLKVNNCDLKPHFADSNNYNPVSRRLADISLANKHLNFSPDVSLEEGLKKTSEWYFETKQENKK
ncbi:MAG: UDP-glucose 4-epimerase [Ignavibacteria bacterium]|nr:UDP-glucose 4-epimerase [Ignavibacteria bacterium]